VNAEPPKQRFNLRRFLLSGAGWPYLLVPFIPVAVGLEIAHASAAVIFGAAALGSMSQERADEVLAVYRQLTDSGPRELTAVITLRLAPPAPFLPPEWHGKPIV
jgi:hypothetical protein